MAISDELFYGNATSDIEFINRSFEDIYQENDVLSSVTESSPIYVTYAQMNITEIL